MLFATGLDIVEVARIRKACREGGERFLNRTFTPKEIDYCKGRRYRFEHYAARFAAKEAFFKAIGTGWRKGLSWIQVEVRHDEYGQPLLHLEGRAQDILKEKKAIQWPLSMTHTHHYAAAHVLLVLEEK